MNKKNYFLIIAGFILFAALSRILPHPYNFTPLGAIALFGAAYFTDKKWAILIPLFAMWMSDLVLNNWIYSYYFSGFTLFNSGMFWVYGSLIIIALLGMKFLKKITLPRVVMSAFGASAIFFIVSNLGVWVASPMYPLTWGGLIACYTAAIPFFHNTIAGDLFYCGVMFGAFEYAKLRFPSLSAVQARN